MPYRGYECIYNIIEFDFLDTDNFHTVFHLREDSENKIILTEILEIHYINMVKWRKYGKIDIINEPLHRWLTWLDKNSPPDLVEEVVKMDNAITAANERQVYFTNDDEEIRAYEMREMALMDERARIRYATDEGLKQGREQGLTEGRREEKLDLAQKALAEGATPEFVEKITGLSAETIKGLIRPK